jgi:hypothetical protein
LQHLATSENSMARVLSGNSATAIRTDSCSTIRDQKFSQLVCGSDDQLHSNIANQ